MGELRLFVHGAGLATTWAPLKSCDWMGRPWVWGRAFDRSTTQEYPQTSINTEQH
jgi:hypothetical protein